MKGQTRLFNAATREVIRGAEARTWRVLLASLTVIVSVLMGLLHYEWPIVDFLRGACDPASPAVDCPARSGTSLRFGVAVALVLAAVSVAVHRYRPIRPTVACEGCGGTGWVLDLERFDGRCPHCAHDGFTYRAWMVRATGEGGGLRRVVEHGARGTTLLARYRASRKSAMNRYY